MEHKTAQLRIRRKVIIEEGCGGSIILVTPSRARALIDAGAADLMNAQPGPAETKPAGPLEKKFSAAVPAGRSTDSAASSEPGTAASVSVSVVVPALPKGKLKRLAKVVTDSLRLTTPID